MVLPDLNLLIYAYNAGAPMHAQARQWWEELLNSDTPVALPAAVAVGFIRLMTNPRVVQPPMLLGDAVAAVEEWLAAPQVSLIGPGPAHWRILSSIGWTGTEVSDAHLAALALEHRCELHSADADFAGCRGLRAAAHALTLPLSSSFSNPNPRTNSPRRCFRSRLMRSRGC